MQPNFEPRRQAESELRAVFFTALRTQGIPRADARHAARKAAKDACLIVKRFGPRDFALVGLPHPEGGVLIALEYSDRDLNGSQRDISASMCRDAAERVLGAGR